jgi:acetolactate synthase-1/2/3 large subunit
MAQHTGAEMFADMFAGYGVSHVFFVPTILNRALVEMERRTDIARIVTHAEKAAAYMADGYGRASNRPGVCMSQVVGAANLAAGLRDGYMANSPIIAITGGPFPHSRQRHQYQEIEDLPMFKPVTKVSTPVADVATIPHYLRQAFRVATTGRPGPVHIEMLGHHGDILEQQTADVDLSIEQRFMQAPAFRPGPDRAEVSAAAAALSAAQRPVIVLGTGARTSGAGPAALAIAEHCSIPVATSMGGKDLIASDHPLSIGVVGLYSRETANRIVGEADLVFFVGSSTGSQVTHSWRLPQHGTTVIQCDIAPEVLGLNYPNHASLLGDARRCLEEVLAGLEGAGAVTSARDAWLRRVAEIKSDWATSWEPLLRSDASPIRPERLCTELSDMLPDDALVVSDTGHAGMWTGGMVDLRHGAQGFLRAAGSLGWAFPASLGAKCAQPDRPVVAFTGDGGFWYHLAEVETAVRWGINTVTVVNNNNALNQEINIWTEAYGGSLEGRHHELWKFTDVNFADLAASMGAAAFRVEKPGDLRTSLDAAFAADRPAVVEVLTEVNALAPTGYAP